jgi:hypothetical protein
MQKFAKTLVQSNPDLANEIYFALDEELVKKRQPWQDLNDVMHEWINPIRKKFGPFVIRDAGDGTGDAILHFPDDFCKFYGWEEGDTLNLEISEDKTLFISKKI